MAEKESGEDILRAILEKGSDKAKKDAADVLSSLDSAPVEAKVKRKRALGDLVGKIGKSTYFKKTDGTIVDDTGKPVSDRLQEAFHSNADVKTGMPKAPTKVGVQKNKEFENSLQKTIVSAKRVADTSELIYNRMPAVTDQLTSIANTLYEQNQNTIRNLIRKNEEFRDAVIEQLTGVKGPTKAGGAVSRPRKQSAVPAVSGSKVAKAAETQTRVAKATSFRTSRPAEVQARAGRIGAIRARRNVAMGAAAIAGGAAIGAGAIIAATTMGGAPSAPPGGGPAAPGPTGTQPSAGAQPSSTPGMVTLTTPISKRQYVVAEQYANNFKGFVDELENSGYQIKSIGGYANRNIAGTGQKSFHALGVSIDINPSSNPHLFDGRTVTDMPSNVSAMARKYGLGWGGDWTSSKDTMHFSMASQEGGSVRIDRSGVAPLPGAPETPGTTAMAAAGAGAAPAGVAGGAPPTLPQTQGAPAGAPTTAPGVAPLPPVPGAPPTVKDIAQYIVSKAQAMGVDPNLALGIAAYEGLNANTIGSPTFGNKDARGYSFGPYQLYSGSPDPTRIAPGGMAAEFMQKYGEPPSASNWQKQVDFSLELMKRRGPAGLERGPWYAVRDRGGVANITRLGAAYAAQQGVVPGELAPPGAAAAAPSAEAVPPGAPTPTLPQTQGPPAGAPTPAPSGPAAGTGGVGALAGPGGQENIAGAPPSNVSIGPNVDLSKVDPDLLQRFYKAAAEYGGPVRINSAYRGDEYQAQLWVRANILKEPGIYSPAKPKEETTITYQGKQYTVPGGGKGSAHSQGRALDVSPAEAMDPYLKRHGLNRPHASFDPPHVMKIGGEPFDADSGTQVAGGPQRTSAPSPTGGPNPQQQAAAPPRPAPPPAMRPGPQQSMMPQQQMAAMSQQNAMQDFFSAMMGMQQPIIMNNTRMINNTRTVFQQPSYVPSRGRMEDVNPLVIAGAAAGFGIARALRIF